MTKKIKIWVRSSFLWRLQHWWFRLTKQTSIQVGTVFFGKSIHLAVYRERPCKSRKADVERIFFAQTEMTLEQAEEFRAELDNQIERMKAFS
jgi:hypothetical protein